MAAKPKPIEPSVVYSEAITFPVHPAAEIFPLMTGVAFTAFVEDIRRNGQKYPIVMYDGAVLEGRNRRRACDIIGREPLVVEWPGGSDPLAFVISHNLHRRHLTVGQRAMIGARMANMKSGQRTDLDLVKNLTRLDVSLQEAADLMQISRPMVSQARTVLEHGTPEEIAMADRGEIKVTTLGNRIRARLPPETRRGGGARRVKPLPTGPAEIVQLHPNKSGRKVGPVLPADMTPEFVARRAVALRDEGKPVNTIAAELHIARQACAQMIDIVLIADRTDLSQRDAQIAATALHRMKTRSQSLDAIYVSIIPIATRLWGEGTKGGASRKEREATRLERFERGLGVLLQACANGPAIEIPHLSPQRAAEIQSELRQAVNDVKILSDKIGSMHR